MAGQHAQKQLLHEPGFRIVMAMELGRGIGFKNGHPWPFIKRDYDHYTRLSYTPRTSGKKVIHIMGRVSFQNTSPELLRKAFNIIISKTLKERPEHADGIAPDFDAALRMASSPEVYDIGDDVWIMGGQRVYEEALISPRCEKIYMTRIFNSYQCDSFMPEFESDWNLVKGSMIDERLIEENGVTYQFEVYEPRKSDVKAWPLHFQTKPYINLRSHFH